MFIWEVCAIPPLKSELFFDDSGSQVLRSTWLSPEHSLRHAGLSPPLWMGQARRWVDLVLFHPHITASPHPPLGFFTFHLV